MGVETLYKISNPEKGMSECYELIIESVSGEPGREYRFRETHGWWDEPTRCFVHQVWTISPEDGVSFTEAQVMYEAALKNRARNGFVHAFSPDFFGEKPYEYRLLH